MAKILIVDDEPNVRLTLGEFLRKAGHTVTEAENVARATEQLRAAPVDVVLTDIVLPESDGIELVRQTHDLLPGVPVVLMTGNPTAESASGALRAGAFDYLCKPISRDALLRAVDGALRYKALQDEKRKLQAENREYQVNLQRLVEERTAQLREREQRLREQARLLELATNAISVRKLDGTVLYWNRGAETIFGVSAANAVGRPISEVMCCGPTTLAEAEEALQERGEWSGELEITRKDGRLIRFQTQWTLLRDPLGRPDRVLCIGSDITEKKRLEEQYLRAQRLESIGLLTGGIAHDLNNILTPVLMSLDLLRDEVLSEDGKRILQTVEQSVRRGAELVKQLLSFAGGLRGKRGDLSPGSFLRDVARLLKETFPKNIEVRVHTVGDLPAIQADPTQLHQVLINLCLNARDAMPEGGTLTLAAQVVTLDEAYCAMRRGISPGRYVEFQVTDTGSGIPEAIRDKIFDPFFTTKEAGQGSGLGLATARGIVQGHGGFVTVTSEVGRGTTFRVYLPVIAAAAGEPAAQAEVVRPRGHGELILVVDDEQSVLHVTRRILESAGYRVLAACSSTEALGFYADCRKEIAAVIADLMMPVMDGLALARALIKMNPQVKILAATGLTAPGTAAKIAEAGIRQWIAKPFTADRLLTGLDKLLHEA